jgi:regulator of protease activity HflC (stomatin/prohibitin superfamily)
MSWSRSQLVPISLAIAASAEILFAVRYDLGWLLLTAALQIASGIRCGVARSGEADETGVARPKLRRFGVLLLRAVLLGFWSGIAMIGIHFVTSTSITVPSQVAARVAGGLLVLLGCVWLILRATLDDEPSGRRTDRDDLSELRTIVEEQAIVAWLFALGLGVSTFAPNAFTWLVRFAAAWTVASAAEIAVRSAFAFAKREPISTALRRPSVVYRFFCFRRSEIGHGTSIDTIHTLSSLIERIRPPLISTAVAFCVVAWLTTAAVLVPIGSRGVYSRLGHLTPEPLGPGLHVTLPAPFGRVRIVDTSRPVVMPLGFHSESPAVLRESFLWTRPHGGEEYPILVGTGAEAVVVNGYVRFRVSDDSASLSDYVTAAESPEATLRRLAHQALLEELRGLDFATAIGPQRVRLAECLQQRIAAAAGKYRLGLKILECGVISVHPPVEAATAYFDVINAETESARQSAEAMAFAAGELDRCRMMSDTSVADARAQASRRLSNAETQALQFEAQAATYRSSPRVARDRLYSETLGPTLGKRPLVLVDAALPASVRMNLESPDGAAK